MNKCHKLTEKDLNDIAHSYPSILKVTNEGNGGTCVHLSNAQTAVPVEYDNGGKSIYFRTFLFDSFGMINL